MGFLEALPRVYHLSLMTLSYIVGELTHFLINTTSREVAREIEYGEKSCFPNKTITETMAPDDKVNCTSFKNESDCTSQVSCYWDFNGLGIDYQVLAGPSFIQVFIFSAVLMAIMSDLLYKYISRTWLLAAGTITFSCSCLLMGLSSQYWHLVILRMLIAMGLSVCRPVSGSLIAEMFTSSHRGVANGIFSWGVYYGYGLAFVFGIYITDADVLGYGWRAPYVLAGLPGILIAILILLTFSDPRDEKKNEDKEINNREENFAKWFFKYLKKLFRNFCSPTMIILVFAAFFRHTAGYCWAFNTRNFFQVYYPDYDIGTWILCASVFGGSFGVFAGGFFSDRLVKHLGLPSRLWLLFVTTLAAAPLAVGTLYFKPPGAFGCLIGYYFLAETWFAVLFTVIVEIVPPEVRSTCIAVFLFLMNLVGGNLPVIVAPLRKYFDDYRNALYLVWPGFLTISSFIFLLASLPLWLKQRRGNIAN